MLILGSPNKNTDFLIILAWLCLFNRLIRGIKNDFSCIQRITLRPPIIFGFYFVELHIKYHLLNRLKIKRDINQQYLNMVNLFFFQIWTILFLLKLCIASAWHNCKWQKITMK